jgi:hypothetical protein
MSPISIALHIRSGRIPVQWRLRQHELYELRDVDRRVLAKGGSEMVFWPKVIEKAGILEVDEIEDPLDLRAEIFKTFNTNRTEDAALHFLHRVGAWKTVEGQSQESWAEGTYATVAYGHRQAIGLRVLPITVDELWQDVRYWYKLLGVRNPTQLRTEFKRAPAADARPGDLFEYAGNAHFSNTLPVSLEWHGKDPYSVVETLTAWELMIATAWADVIARAEKYVCANCGTRFTWPRKKKHCRWECGHLVAVRRYKRKKALEKRRQTHRDRSK